MGLAVTLGVSGCGGGSGAEPAPLSTATDSATLSVGSTVTATASDNVAIDRVVFTVNGTTLCTQRSSPYTCRWLVPKKANVHYTIGATVFDSAGNLATHTITVTSR